MTTPTMRPDAGSRRQPAGDGRGAPQVASLAAGSVVMLLAVLAPVIADTAPFLPSSGSWLFTATQALFLMTLATNWATVAAVLGRLDLGHAVFVGAGAYAAGGLLITTGTPPLIAVLVGGLAAGALGAAMGAATLRLAPHLFAVATFALLILVREAVRLAEPVTRGAQGLALPPELSPVSLYWLTLVVVATSLALSWSLRTGQRPGTDEGGRTDAHGWRLGAYTAVAASTGLVGALWAIQRLFIDPNNAFQALRTFDMAIAAVVGGLGSITGPLVGATALFTAREAAPVAAASWQPLIEVAVLVVVVLARPEGLVRGPLPIGERLFGVAAGGTPPRRPFRPATRQFRNPGGPGGDATGKEAGRVD